MLHIEELIKRNTPDADCTTIKRKLISLVRTDFSKLEITACLILQSL